MQDDRPLISVIVLAYNQERFIAEAVQGAFDQTYSPLEIILSDDCSPDRTFEIMQEMAADYQGPHMIILNRNEHNLGLIGHINYLMELARGKLIIAAAGDDISLPNRVERIYQEHISCRGQAYSIFSNAIWIDEHSQKMNLLRRKPVNNRDLSLGNYASRFVPGFVNGATHAWRREDFDLFGPLPINVGSEDTTIPFRSALLGHICYIHEPLVLYRRHSDRMLNSNGHFDFFKYREALIKQRRNHLAMYQCRLDDINLFLSDLNGVENESTKYVIDWTKKRIIELKTRRPLPIFVWIGYLKRIIYFNYQNIWRRIKANI